MNKHIGSHFDDFLKEEGILDDAEAVAVKRMTAQPIQQEFKETTLGKQLLSAVLEAMKQPENGQLIRPNFVKKISNDDETI